jgi:tyrosine-protein kinase
MGDYLSVLRRRKLLISTLTLLGLGMALFYSMAIATPIYTSQSQVLVRPVLNDPFDASAAAADKVLNMGTERELVKSDSVAMKVKERLNISDSISKLHRRLGVQVLGSTQILSISFNAPSKVKARQTAQAFAESYLELKRELSTQARDRRQSGIEAALRPVADQITEAQRSLATSPPGSSASAEADARLKSLHDQAAPYLSDLASVRSIDPEVGGAMVSPANLPNRASSPRPKFNALLGAFFGFFIGLLLAFFRDRTDGRLRGRSDLEEHLRAPVLATVPRTRRNGRAVPTLVTMQHPNSPASEAYRALRTRMLVMAERREMKTIMVASPSGEDGKTAIAANLAVSLAQVGKRVVLLSADLRKSMVHQYFGLDNDRGLSNVLSGEMPPWEAVQEPAGMERLWVFGSGPTPLQPTELLQSDLMKELLAERRKVADFVIIEAPPALDTADCLALAPLVDGIVLVADARSTSRDEVALVREQFDQVGGQVVGSVLSNANGHR